MTWEVYVGGKPEEEVGFAHIFRETGKQLLS